MRPQETDTLKTGLARANPRNEEFKMVRLKKVDVLSCAKLSAVSGGVIGLFLGVLYSLPLTKAILAGLFLIWMERL